MWTRYRVRWEFLTDLNASTPADENLIEKWLQSRQPKVKPPQARSMDEINAEVLASVMPPARPPGGAAEDDAEAEELPPSLLVFQRNPDGVCCMRADTIRAHLKDCASTLSSLYVGKVTGERSFAVRAKNAIYWPPEEYWVPILTREGTPVREVTGTETKAIHVMTRKGPMNALKVYEYISNAAMEFTLQILTNMHGTPVISEPDLKSIMMYGAVHGYAGERSLSGGRYTFSISTVA